MKRIFKNSILRNTILILIMLFSVNNVVLAKNRYFSDGSEINEKFLNGVKATIYEIYTKENNPEEQDLVNKNRIMLNRLRKERKNGQEYLKLACEEIEDVNINIYKEAKQTKDLDLQEGTAIALNKLSRLEQELMVKQTHHFKIKKILKKHNLF